MPKHAVELLRLAYHAFYRVGIRLWIRYAGLADRGEGRRHGFGALPPALLLYRVRQSPRAREFLEVGERCAQAVASILGRSGRPLDSCENVLDLGCGCGRTLLWFVRQYPHVRFHACDTDGEAIDWCREHLRCAQFRRNHILPPLEYPDGGFDLVYAISVFTHLDAEPQRLWLAELRRVLRPGAMLLVSLHGPAAWSGLDAEQLRTLRDSGFLFTTSTKLQGIVPDWYQTAYHSPEFARALVGAHFEVTDYIPGGLGYQDVLLARR